MIPDSDIHAVIHLSSTAVYTVVGYFDVHHKKTQIMGLGLAKTDAFFGGQIVNREHLLSAIHKSLREAIDMAGVQVSYVGLSFASPAMMGENGIQDKIITGQNPTGDTLGRKISHDDVRDILNDAKVGLAQKGHKDVQLCQQRFWLDDDQSGKDVVGMLAHKLTVGYHLISVPSMFYAQIKDLMVSNNLEVHPMFFDGITSSEYALSSDEKQRGVCFIDIGAALTKVCLYQEGMLLYTRCLPVGGQLVDMDIASTLGLTLLEAESLKKHHGSANASKQSKSDFITLKKRHHDSELTVHLYKLASIIEARYLALLYEIFDELTAKGLDQFMDMGVVLAGGGADMRDLPSLIERQFGVSVRQMDINPKVAVHTELLSDDDIGLLKTHLSDPKLHSIIGALMYYQSEQYARDERGQFGDLDRVGFFGRVGQKCQSWFDKLRQLL
ncbi:cell division protein FtsA [Moraxella bovis]|uniref:Cell division protein FtsA n=1 Tax=Moraxella bovis TaxID=476 RepID=A0AAQ2SYV3_MORBO|nr:cell division protein FtsA [Moraxella bovis]AWY20959.1 cell division protein FtsA [Moraxella bovis]OOR90343.1 cell division protein FtsA [Moraxella bovis]UYZ69076.1 cell division protein FtsA [Moraxella bovis]UYZ71450.1 cell division protein FtsA [Moraxella bovis]UYZ72637.1 cell division protein FtsA [Moraxella bovis]